MPEADELKQHTFLAMAGACCMMAHQVAGKAARDGFFLTRFPATDLPKVVMAAALLSVAIALWSPRLLRRWGPGKVIPSAFAVSGLAHVGEWFVRSALPSLIAVVVYLHVVALGAVLLSGFWLLLNEFFDPHEAKRRFGRVAASGTFGGVIGGIAAERLVHWFGSGSMLLLLGTLHLGCAAIVGQLRPSGASPSLPAEDSADVSVAHAFRKTPLLWGLAALVFLGSCGAALLDYLFKSGAAQEIGRGRELVRYFALYYTGCQVLTLLMQVVLTRRVLERWGIARTAASLPLVAGTGSAAVLLMPVFPLLTAVRASEQVLRGSFFRSAYELLYAPVSEQDKRSAKTMIDVACDRLGDAAGAGAVQWIVWAAAGVARPWILGMATLISVAGAAIALLTGRAYRGVLEQGLLRRAQIDPMVDAAMGDYLGLSMLDSLPAVAQPMAEKTAAAAVPQPAPRPDHTDAVTRALSELRSAVPTRVLTALGPHQVWDPILGAQAIQLLAWDEVSPSARTYLERGGTHVVGQLTDTLLGPDVDFGIRRRVPRLLARAGGQRSVDGLMLGLNDSRFEVRFQCGRALEYLRQRHADLSFPAEEIYRAVDRELSVSKTVWRSWRVLDRRDASDPVTFLDEVLRERADQRLEHVFSLLAVVLPREPLMAAFRGLHQEDRSFRGLALEYLETTLPAPIREKLWLILEESPDSRRTTDPAQAEAIMASLLRSDSSLLLKLPPLEKES